MVSRNIGLVGKGCLGAFGLALALMGSTGEAQARRHHPAHHNRQLRHAAHRVSLVDSPAFSAMVVDANTGRTLYAANENALRHPASLTKVMTLYLLFEQLERGEIRLDTRIGVSAHAAAQAPTKLGLRPGSTIAIEDAIKSIVTKSANDMAVAVAEAIGGNESSFAAMMTRKAHALGMARTQYVNASGLPDDRQLTTAHDLTVLGRAIRENYPKYYHYFSTPSFTYAGSYMPNHNHLLGKIEGMDGIKTGYTRASGFNLLSSVSRDGHRIVSVVLGGRTAAGRDRIMASLIEDHIDEAATTRVAQAIPDSPIEAPSEPVHTAAVEENDGAVERLEDRGPSLIAPTMAVPPAPIPVDRARTLSQARAERAPSPIERPRPAFIAGAPKIDPSRLPPPMSARARQRLALDGSTSARPAQPDAAAVALATATPSTLRWVTGPAGVKPGSHPKAGLERTASLEQNDRAASVGQDRDETTQAARNEIKDRTGSIASHGGWIIQIGATDAPEKAAELLNRARSQGRSALASAHPFTEKVRRGEATLYRARFTGLDPNEAQLACKTLKRSGFSCFAAKD